MALGGWCPALRTQHSGHLLGAQVMPGPPSAQGGGSAPYVTCPEVREKEVPLVVWGQEGLLPLGCLALAPQASLDTVIFSSCPRQKLQSVCVLVAQSCLTL